MSKLLHGLIQHSFAVRISRDLRPRYAREHVPCAHSHLRTIFEELEPRSSEPVFRLGEAEMKSRRWGIGGAGPWDHSMLVHSRETTIEPRPFPFKQEERPMPAPLAWAKCKCPRRASTEEPWDGFVFGGVDRPVETSHKDFLLERTDAPREGEGVKLSRLLCQLLAQRRSRLFGLPLARETINVFLPHAVLGPDQRNNSKGWFVQPLLSLSYVYGSRGFRPIFSFSLFLVPCDASNLQQRTMSTDEMHESVRNQWPLATIVNPEERPAYTVSGPLGDYLDTVAGPALGVLGIRAANGRWTANASAGTPECQQLTLRKFTEATLFSIALRMTQGARCLPSEETRKEIGDRVLTALTASRVSSVVVVSDNCAATRAARHSSGTCGKANLSGLLTEVSADISRPYRMPWRIQSEGREGYRLDRDFFDTDRYAIAVLPSSRCIVMVGDGCAQDGLESSALLESGWTAYMVIGVATATGMIRSVFRDIIRSDRSKPDSIADIEREAMVELHETFDLEIMTESYRTRYRLLREHLGITTEFKALSDKLEALYRETSTRFDSKSAKRLLILTVAIVILSAVIAVGTLILIHNHG